jgi:hypothetical protein
MHDEMIFTQMVSSSWRWCKKKLRAALEDWNQDAENLLLLIRGLVNAKPLFLTQLETKDLGSLI